MTRRDLPLALTALGAVAAQPPSPPPEEKQDEKMPDGRLKSELLLKADHESNLKDLDEINRLTDAIRKDLEKNDRHVLSMVSLKNLEEIEKLAKRIHSRMRRF